MEPVSLAPILPTACAAALAGVALLQRKRIRGLRGRLDETNRSDPLTGLLNHRAFEERLEVELERAARGGRRLSMVVGDLDAFHSVNERQGHAAGDAALQSVAQNLLKWKRRIDIAARVGGEEFALLLPETDERGAFIVAERLRRAALGRDREGGLLRPGGQLGARALAERPATVAADLDLAHVVALAVEPRRDRARGRERDLVLRGAAAREHGDPKLRH